MNKSKRIAINEWLVLLVLGLSGLTLWFFLSLPRFSAIDLSVNQSKAVSIAEDFLKISEHINTEEYISSAIFDSDDGADRYLQKTIGPKDSKILIDKIHYDLFYWVVRFFKEKQKEEFRVVVSSKTGEVIAFYHIIDETAARPTVDKEQSLTKAVDFLKNNFGFDPSVYVVHNQDQKKFDHRTEYSFSWEDNRVKIPWNPALGGGTAKILIKVVVSGDDILSFNKSQFEIPDGFNRYIDNLKQTGQNLSMLFKVLYLALLTLSIMLLVNRKNHTVPRIVKPLYWRIGIFIFICTFIETLNAYQLILFDYSTAQSFADHLIRQLIESLVNPFFVVIAFIIPAMAGEALRSENNPNANHRGFLGASLSSFLTRSISEQIAIGYLIAWIVLGLQALIFTFGYQCCGVWDELSWLTQASTNVFPAFTAFLIGVHASFSEEAMFRLFAINFFKKYAKITWLAVFLSALIWGFGHTGYEIFPMWFRGLEVTCLGIILGIAYLWYGLVTTLVAHYFMDSFLTSLPYLLKPQISVNFIGALVVISLPIIYALIAYIKNQSQEQRSWVPRLNEQQQFNYDLLKNLLSSKTPDEQKQFKRDLLHHGWDPLVVERVFNEKEAV